MTEAQKQQMWDQLKRNYQVLCQERRATARLPAGPVIALPTGFRLR